MRTEWELTDVLIDCFSDHLGTPKEELLHDDRYVTKTLKQHLGSKLYKEYDELGKQQWNNAWMDFGIKASKMNT